MTLGSCHGWVCPVLLLLATWVCGLLTVATERHQPARPTRQAWASSPEGGSDPPCTEHPQDCAAP